MLESSVCASVRDEQYEQKVRYYHCGMKQKVIGTLMFAVLVAGGTILARPYIAAGLDAAAEGMRSPMLADLAVMVAADQPNVYLERARVNAANKSYSPVSDYDA